MFDLYMKKGIKEIALLLIFILVGFGYAQGQKTTDNLRKGIVLDDFGNPLADVRVSVKGADTATISDDEGYFELVANENSTLVFQHPRFYTYELPVQPDRVDLFNVQLKDSYLKQPETIDVLYGTAQEDELLGAVSTIHTNQLNTSLSPNYISALAGRMPGLYVQQNRGIRNAITESNTSQDLVGSIPQIGRGIPSDNTMYSLLLRGQNPVTVVDGIQRDIFSVDPSNIESVSVQKDALSSILLGMRSSRGVLLITTKKPVAEGFQMSFSGEVGVQKPLNMPKPLSTHEYAYLLNEALMNSGQVARYNSADFAAFRDGSSPYTNPSIDWYNTVLEKSSPISSYNLNASGGGKVARYSVSLNYLNQQGLFKTSDLNSYQTNAELNRYLFTSNIDLNVTDEFKVGVNLFGRVQEGTQPGAGIGTILNNVLNTPNSAYPIRNPNNSYGGNVSFPNNLYYQALHSGYLQDDSRDIMANVNMDYDFGDFVEGLSAKAITNISVQNLSAIIRNKRSIVYEFVPGEESDAEGTYLPFGSNSPQSNDFNYAATTRFWYGQLSLNYATSIGKHDINGMVMGDNRIVSSNFDLPAKSNNLAAKVKYSYADKYFAEAAIDFSSFNRYPTDEQWGTFYAFGLGWDLAKESFLDQVSWLDQFKLRGVYGKTGNGIDNSGYYIWRQTFSTNVFGGTGGAYPQGYSRATGNAMVANTLANPNITWEKADKIDVGVDVSLFNEHLQLTGDYYHDTYYDLLQVRGKNIALLGAAYPFENIGKNLYKGVELSLTYQNNLGNFNYFVTGNWSQMETEVLFMDEQYREYDYNKRTGNPVGAIYGLVADGFFASPEEIAGSATFNGIEVQPGDIKYKDLNHDGVINTYDVKAIGNTKPLSFYGLTVGFDYKGIDFSILLQGAYNRDLYLGDLTTRAGFQQLGQNFGQAYQQITGRWTPETADIATHPRLTAGRNANNAPDEWTSFYVESGDYIRVKNVSLGYTLPSRWTYRHGIPAIRFFVNAQNIFTEAAYDLVDPEVTSFASYPIQQVISGGVSIKL